MKNLGKVFVFTILTLFSVQSFAQKFGIQGGINLSNMLVKDNEGTYSEDFKMNLGYSGGVTFEMGLGKIFSLEAGALVNSKGFKWELDGGTAKLNLMYVDIPVLLKAGLSLGPVKVFAAAGPYAGMGITGKMVAIPDQGDKETESINWGTSEDDDLKRLDYGAKFGGGVELSSFTFGVYYSLGLANLEAITDGGSQSKSKVLNFSVGYKF
jgi:hypothetical protein